MLKVAGTAQFLPSTGAAIHGAPVTERTSVGFSTEAKLLEQIIYGSSSRTFASFNDASELPQSAFDLKTAIAPFSMHLPKNWRDNLFVQIDQILCKDSWDIDDPVPSTTSWATFIRLVVHCRFKVLPGLGFANGNPMLSWIHEKIRINITCYPNDAVRWTASRFIEGELETSIGDTKPRRIMAVLEAYNDAKWLFDGAS